MEEDAKIQNKEHEVEGETLKVKAPRKRPPPYCRFFNKKEGCRNGESCRFRHVLQEKNSAPEVEAQQETEEQVQSEPRPSSSRAPVIPQRVVLTKDQSGSEEQEVAKAAELTYFKRRYKNCLVMEKEDKSTEITFKYLVTDPDWVFDVKTLTFTFVLLENHPISNPMVTMPEQPNRCLPDHLRNYVQKTIEKAIAEKYKLFASRNGYEIMGKNLIHWIDRNMLPMFVEGLRQQKLVLQAESAGITLVSSGKSQKNTVANQIPGREDTSEALEQDEQPHSSQQSIPKASKSTDLKPVQEYPLQLTIVWKNESQNIASLSAVSLTVLFKCIRCREESSRLLTATGIKESRCSKCALVHSIRTRGELVHENSSLILRMDARGCQPVDLVLLATTLRFVCLGCNKEDEVHKINYGQNHRSYCKACHRLCEFIISVARFSGDFAKCSLPATPSSALPKPSKQKNAVLGPVITPGSPLPDQGSCKHYRKSYRWFRFPCCGRAFPCDTCHEEANLGHEMKVANRMICGHCSTEQPFIANKPCSQCHENVTRSRSHFWEGGKGCRDPKMMNKNDPHKFAGKKPKKKNQG